MFYHNREFTGLNRRIQFQDETYAKLNSYKRFIKSIRSWKIAIFIDTSPFKRKCNSVRNAQIPIRINFLWVSRGLLHLKYFERLLLIYQNISPHFTHPILYKFKARLYSDHLRFQGENITTRISPPRPSSAMWILSSAECWREAIVNIDTRFNWSPGCHYLLGPTLHEWLCRCVIDRRLHSDLHTLPCVTSGGPPVTGLV